MEGLTMKEKYCITAINRLTGEREIISKAYPDKAEAETAYKKLMGTKPGKRPYKYPQIAVYPKQLNIFTNQLDV